MYSCPQEFCSSACVLVKHNYIMIMFAGKWIIHTFVFINPIVNIYWSTVCYRFNISLIFSPEGLEAEQKLCLHLYIWRTAFSFYIYSTCQFKYRWDWICHPSWLSILSLTISWILLLSLHVVNWLMKFIHNSCISRFIFIAYDTLQYPSDLIKQIPKRKHRLHRYHTHRPHI